MSYSRKSASDCYLTMLYLSCRLFLLLMLNEIMLLTSVAKLFSWIRVHWTKANNSFIYSTMISVLNPTITLKNLSFGWLVNWLVIQILNLWLCLPWRHPKFKWTKNGNENWKRTWSKHRTPFYLTMTMKIYKKYINYIYVYVSFNECRHILFVSGYL